MHHFCSFQTVRPELVEGSARTGSWVRVFTGALGLMALLAGCAGPAVTGRAAPSSESSACVAWYEQLDAVTRQAGVRDGGSHRVPGYPFLRADRFLASFGDEAANQPASFEAWVGRLAELDRDAREVELSNLPLQFLPLLETDSAADKQRIRLQTQRCANQASLALLQSASMATAPGRRLLTAQAQVPDDYSPAKRALGLYALTRVPFFAGVQRWQQTTADKFAAPPSVDAAAVKRYTPAGEAPSADRIAEIYKQRNPDAIGIPRFSPLDADLLLRAYAPDVHIETHGNFDRFGAMQWNPDRALPGSLPPGSAQPPTVLIDQPVMYQRIAYTRYQNQILLQLVYSVWFPERPLSGGIDLLGGQLDSVVLRLTLAPDGTPWLYDSIHSCGCYHLFFPTPSAKALAPPSDSDGSPPQRIEWAFVPAALPALKVGQRMALHLESGTHYVEGLRPVAAAAEVPATPYALRPDGALRTLPVSGALGGVTRSAFWPHGIVPGTERGERLLFWPMGIDNPGAMRQWGRQPTAFVGRRHFDDARLMELRFELKSERSN
jgi:hypothetical protein